MGLRALGLGVRFACTGRAVTVRASGKGFGDKKTAGESSPQQRLPIGMSWLPRVLHTPHTMPHRRSTSHRTTPVARQPAPERTLPLVLHPSTTAAATSAAVSRSGPAPSLTQLRT